MKKIFFIFILLFISNLLFPQNNILFISDTIPINRQYFSLNFTVSKWSKSEKILKITEIKKISENKYIGNGYLKYNKYNNYTYGKIQLTFTIIKVDNVVIITFSNFKHTSNYMSFGDLSYYNIQPKLSNSDLHPDMDRVLWIDLTDSILLQTKIVEANLKYFIK